MSDKEPVFYGNTAARAEGWVLVRRFRGADYSCWQVRRFGKTSQFRSDFEAQCFVRSRANGNFPAVYHDAWELHCTPHNPRR